MRLSLLWGKLCVMHLHLVALLLVASPNAPAGPGSPAPHSAQLEEAAASVRDGHPEKAEEILTALVAKGDARAMLQLSGLMMKGVVAGGVDKAIPLLQQSADAGEPDAMADLGRMLMLGDGVKQDASKARPLLEKAVERGNTRAMITLGESLISGPLEQDLPRGEALLRSAAEKGDGNAMSDLGMALLQGMLGRPPEPQLAIEWMEKGVKAGNVVAAVTLGKILMSPPAGVKPDLKRGMELLLQAAEGGNLEAMRNIAWLFENAKPPLHDVALVWYERAAAAGDELAAKERDRLKAQPAAAP